MKQLYTMHLSLGSLREYRNTDGNNGREQRYGRERDPLYISPSTSPHRSTRQGHFPTAMLDVHNSPPCITIDDDSPRSHIPTATFAYVHGSPPCINIGDDSSMDSSNDSDDEKYFDFEETVTISRGPTIEDLQARVASLERKLALDKNENLSFRVRMRTEVAALKKQVDELRNQRPHVPYTLRSTRSAGGRSNNQSHMRPHLTSKTVMAIDRLRNTMRCRGLIYRHIVEWCKGKNIAMNASHISSFFTKKFQESRSQEVMKIIRRFLKEVGSVPSKRKMMATAENGRLPEDVRNFIEQCKTKMDEREMSNANLVNWAKEHGVVWNEMDINSFLNEKFDEVRCRDMILHLEPFLEIDD